MHSTAQDGISVINHSHPTATESGKKGQTLFPLCPCAFPLFPLAGRPDAHMVHPMLSPSRAIRSAPAALLALASLAALAPNAEARFEKLLPAETCFAAQIADVPSLLKRAAEHPLAADIQKTKFADELIATIKKYQTTLADLSSEDASIEHFGKIGTDFVSLQHFVNAVRDVLSGEVLYANIKTPKSEKDRPFGVSAVLAETTADITAREIGMLWAFVGLNRNAREEYPEALYDYWKAKERGENPTPPPPPGPDAPKIILTLKMTDTLFQGVTLHEEIYTAGKEPPVSRGGWAFVKKVFIYSSSPSVLRELVDAVQNGRKNNFAETPAWKKSAAAAEPFDVLFVVNTPVFGERFRAGFIARKKADEPTKSKAELRKLYDDLGLVAVKNLWFAARLDKDEVHAKYSLEYSEKRGILSILQFLPLETPVPSFIPAGIVGMSIKRVNFPRLLRSVEKFLTQADSGRSSLSQILDDLKAKEGLDVRGALLENIGEYQIKIGKSLLRVEELSPISAGVVCVEIDFPKYSLNITYQLKTSDDEVGVLEIYDTGKLGALIDTFAVKQGGINALFRETVFMGEKIRSLKFPMAEVADKKFGLSYTLFGGRLLYQFHPFEDAPSVLPEIIAEIKNPKSPAAKEPDMQRLLKRIHKNAYAFNYFDLKDGLQCVLGLIDEQTVELLEKRHAKNEAKAQAAAEKKGEKHTSSPFTSPNMGDHSKAGVVPWVGFLSVRENGNALSGEAVFTRRENPQSPAGHEK
jgi:hypothetical protein